MPRRKTPDPLAAKVGARIRDARLEQRMSQRELAEKCDLVNGYISSIERGLAIISVLTVERLARGLGIRPLDLIAFPEEDERAEIVHLTRKLPPQELMRVLASITPAWDRGHLQ